MDKENKNNYTKSELVKLQGILLEILEETTKIFDDSGVDYVLTCGTALGARRHNGFIPWDDDIDLCVLENDIEKIISLKEKFEEKGLFIQNYKTEPNTPYYFTKIRLKNTIFEERIIKGLDINKGIFLDVFPLKPVPNSRIRYKFNYYFFKIFNLLFTANKTVYSLSKAKRIFELIFKCISFIFPDGYLYSLLKNKFNSNNKDLLGYYGLKNLTFKRNDFLNKIKVPFNEKEFYQLNNVDEYLCDFYGSSYLEIPPLKKRYNHKPITLKFND